jgi:hypothetical protein
MVLKAIFVDESSRDPSILKLDLLQRLSIGGLAGVVLFLGLFPGGLVWKIGSSLP